MQRNRAHPYIPNSAPTVKRELLAAVGAASAEELYAAIPERLRFEGLLDVPAAFASEYELRRHLEGLLDRNTSTREVLSFLGGGCAPHYVPAVVDEIVNRAEFLTSYYGETYGDHGKLQALFEYASMVGELVGLDAVSLPTYDWATAAATAISMAARRTGRTTALVPASMSPERLSVIRGYCEPRIAIRTVASDPATGTLDPDRLERALGESVACLYLETPGYLGVVEAQAHEAVAAAHAQGALAVVGTDPLSLGVLAAPARYGADVVCGDLQPLGIHQHYGGGQAGFLATDDSDEWIAEYPTFLIGLAATSEPGEYGFGEVAWERISYVQRGDAHEYTGTTQNLWAIGAAVYLALLGPEGLAELGRGLMQRAAYAASRLAEVPGVSIPLAGVPFKEVVVAYEGETVAEVNRELRARGIFGGIDLSAAFPHLGQAALMCFTEVHLQADIDRLVDGVAEILR